MVNSMNQGNRQCPNCGGPLNGEDHFCKYCGTPINNQNMQNNPVKKSNNSWIYAVIALVIAAAIGVGVYFYNNKNENITTNEKTTSENNSTTNDNNVVDNSTINDDTTSNSEEQRSNIKSVSFNGLTFDIPLNYTYNIENSTLSFTDSKNTWYVGLQVIEGDYYRLISSKEEIISGIKSKGYEIKTFEQKTYSGKECIMMEASGAGREFLTAYVRANSTKVLVVTVMNLNVKYDYNLFEEYMKILSTAR